MKKSSARFFSVNSCRMTQNKLEKNEAESVVGLEAGCIDIFIGRDLHCTIQI